MHGWLESWSLRTPMVEVESPKCSEDDSEPRSAKWARECPFKCHGGTTIPKNFQNFFITVQPIRYRQSFPSNKQYHGHLSLFNTFPLNFFMNISFAVNWEKIHRQVHRYRIMLYCTIHIVCVAAASWGNEGSGVNGMLLVVHTTGSRMSYLLTMKKWTYIIKITLSVGEYAKQVIVTSFSIYM